MPKLNELRRIIAKHDAALVAFSGGVDSTFLLHVAQEQLGDRCHAVTCVSETMANSEIEDARRLAQELNMGARHHVISSAELRRPGFADNPRDRCALCKTELMEIASQVANHLNISAIFLGTNTDDLGDHRPGIAAAKELGATSPMVEAGLSKADVRAFSKQLGLRTWSKPQLACLSSRFPYGTRITKERLQRVDQFEDGLRAMGFNQLRVRFHETIARLEFDPTDLQRALEPSIRDQILELGRTLGFTYVTVDLAGFRSGSLNESPIITLGKKAS